MVWLWFLGGFLLGVACGLMLHVLLRASRAARMEKILDCYTSGNPGTKTLPPALAEMD